MITRKRKVPAKKPGGLKPLVKGSQEAKAFMARLREMRGKKK